MRQHVGTFHYHLVGIQVTVVARLRKDRYYLRRNLRTVLFGNDLCHQLVFALCHSIEASLSDTVANSGMIYLACRRAYFFIHYICHLAECSNLFALVERSNLFFDDRNKTLCQKQRVASACTRILHGSTIAVSISAVFQYEYYRNGFACLSDCCETLSNRLTFVESTIVFSSRFDSFLVVKEKTSLSFGTYYFFDLVAE